MSHGNNFAFDKTIANCFLDHARKHIPNYDIVIDKSVDFCNAQLNKNQPIIDVGCATGFTLEKLNNAGFTNLTGLDNSPDMLVNVDKTIATYINSSTFPNTQYDMILCNWTLHFIKDKIDYLQNMYNNLTTNGYLILSEKISKDPLLVDMYHQFKKRNGLSDNEINEKSLQIENIMFINDINWYQQILTSIGFKVTIIDAHWCFTTFLCKK